MSGVIIDGVQYERCNGGCGRYPRLTSMWYEPPTEQYQYGRDLCPVCAIKSIREGNHLTPEQGFVLRIK